METFVIKRDGRKEPFNIEKPRGWIQFAYKGLSLNPLELESKISLATENNIKTSTLQELLITIAVSMITEDRPEMALVAGRLAMGHLHREVYKNTKYDFGDFPEYLQYARRNNLYRKDFYQAYSENDIRELAKQLKAEYDFEMDISQVLSLKSKYLLKNKRGIIEYPQFADMTSSMVLASIENNPVKYSKQYFRSLAKGEISLATPFKANLRRLGGNTGSCFILSPPDSIGGITKSWADMAEISKAGGGIGVYLGYLRPGGSWSPEIPKANKIIKWTKIINDIAVAVNQRGIRKGAITPGLDWYHLDIFEFMEMKLETGGDLREKCFDLFPQLIVDDYFVDACKANRDVYLVNHFELADKYNINLPDLVGDDLYTAHEEAQKLAEAGKITAKKVNAKKLLWRVALKTWFESGDFYISHKDNLNLSNYLKAHYIANSANLCVESFSIGKTPMNWKTEAVNGVSQTTETDGLYHSCNLLSINVGVIFTDKDLERVCKTAVRMLDASVDLGTMPVLEAKKSSEWLRNTGIGTVGVADWMAYNKLTYDTPEGLDALEMLQEKIAYYCYNASIDLAIEKGAYPAFKLADYSTMFGKTPEVLTAMSKNGFNWIELNNRIKQHGIRNFLLNAIAPNTSTGILMKATASYLPAHSKFNYQTLASMSVPILPRYLKTRYWYYKTKAQYPATAIIAATRRLQRWTDTGISMEILINPELNTIKEISEAILDGFKAKELKAVYYSLAVDMKKDGCTDCAN